MPVITQVLEVKKVLPYLKKRQLSSAYQKAKKTILRGDLRSVSFKLRKPKHEQVYEFYINHKFRAFGYFEDENIFVVAKISDHQKS